MLNTVLEDTKTCRQRKTFWRGGAWKINIELITIEETEVLIRAAKMTEEVNGILKKLEEPSVQMISGFAGDTLEILEQADIIRVYAAKRKSLCATAKG